MDATLRQETFVDFGEDPLFPYRPLGMSRVDGEGTVELRGLVKQFAPRMPGVYGMLDPLGRLIYVGKSKLLRNRLLSYFLPNNEEDKAGRILESTRSIVWETQPSDFAAWMREQSLIRQLQPRFNVQGIPKRMRPVFICLGKSPAEQLFTSRYEDASCVAWVGPLQGSGRADRAVEVLNRFFQLRDCSSKTPCGFTEQLSLFDIQPRPGCIRYEIRNCLGPCIRGCSRKEYETQVDAAKAFLLGQSTDPIERLQQQMAQSAANRHFEQAAVVREDLKVVQWLSRRVAEMARAKSAYTFVYNVAGHNQKNVWYLIRRGQIEGAIAAPTSSRDALRCKKLVAQWLREDFRIGSRFTPRPETLALVTSWFRIHKEELGNTISADFFLD